MKRVDETFIISPAPKSNVAPRPLPPPRAPPAGGEPLRAAFITAGINAHSMYCVLKLPGSLAFNCAVLETET